MKKLKLAIFAVQAKSDRQLFSSYFQKAIMGADRSALLQPFIQSWCQKVVGGHLPLLEELINYPKAKRQHDLLAQTTMPTNSPPPGRYPTAAFNSIRPPHLAA